MLFWVFLGYVESFSPKINRVVESVESLKSIYYNKFGTGAYGSKELGAPKGIIN